MLIFKRCTRHEYREYYMGNKFCKNNILAFGAYFVLGVCLLFYSCKNKPNSSNGNFTIAESEVSEEKVLPPKDIDSPVKVKEERVYSSNNGSLQDGLITTYDNYVWAKNWTYNGDGYLTHFSYKSDSYTESSNYKYDFSDENYSCVYRCRLNGHIGDFSGMETFAVELAGFFYCVLFHSILLVSILYLAV